MTDIYNDSTCTQAEKDVACLEAAEQVINNTTEALRTITRLAADSGAIEDVESALVDPFVQIQSRRKALQQAIGAYRNPARLEPENAEKRLEI